MPVKRFKIEKVPLEYIPLDHHPQFPAYPVLYLELVENKEKVIPALKNKTQDPIFLQQQQSSIPPTNNTIHSSHQPMDTRNEFFNEKDIRTRLHERLKKPDHQRKPPIEQDRQSVRDRTIEKQREEERVLELSRAREREASRIRAQDRQSYQPSSSFIPPPQPQSSSPQFIPQPQSSPQFIPPPQSSSPQFIPQPSPTQQASSYTSSSQAENAILNVLGPSTNDSSVIPPSYSASSAVLPVATAVAATLPPSLSSITNQTIGAGSIKNLQYVSTEEESNRKRELLFRFDILRKSYKEAVLPEFTEFTDIKTLENTYEDTVRKVGLDSKVEGYKKFLTMGFFGIEFLFTNLLKVDMSGFAKQQLSTMNSYERILIELGEKAMLDKSKSQWPAEIRLMFTILMNAVIFLLMKNVMGGGISSMMGSNNTGSSNDTGIGMMSGIMSMMSGLSGVNNNVASDVMPPPPKPKPKMKGPNINFD
jgi:hypothetical protein